MLRKVMGWLTPSEMEPREFHVRNVTRMQGLMTASIGVYLLLASLLSNGWWQWVQIWSVAIAYGCFILALGAFALADRYYREYLPRPRQAPYVWPTFFVGASALLAVLAWVGHAVSGAALVGAVWMILFKYRTGDGWGFEVHFAVALVVAGVLTPLMTLLSEGDLSFLGTLLVWLFGGVIFLVGISDWMTVRRVERRIREEADELGL